MKKYKHTNPQSIEKTHSICGLSKESWKININIWIAPFLAGLIKAFSSFSWPCVNIYGHSSELQSQDGGAASRTFVTWHLQTHTHTHTPLINLLSYVSVLYNVIPAQAHFALRDRFLWGLTCLSATKTERNHAPLALIYCTGVSSCVWYVIQTVLSYHYITFLPLIWQLKSFRWYGVL